MKTNFQPLQLLLMMFAGWVNRQQQKVIDYLLEENRILKDYFDTTTGKLHELASS